MKRFAQKQTVRHVSTRVHNRRSHQRTRRITANSGPFPNQGMAFPIHVRQMLGMQGLLPPHVATQQEQLDRCWFNFDKLDNNDPMSKYSFLRELRNRNEKLFYKMLLSDLKQLMPIVYTPTVGEACLKFGGSFTRPNGVWISIKDKGHIRQILRNWPDRNVRAICVTDGERILGLGDLGAYGMGIPIGKLALYTACAGVHPSACLPIMIDVGTDNQELLDDPFYVGLKQKRVRGQEYDDLIDEFMEAVRDTYGRLCLVQFEDFANHNAFKFLRKYRNKYCMFNDDIQGTAACATSGLIAAERITKIPTKEHTILFLGAGEAGMGIAGLLQQLFRDEGISAVEVNKRINFFDAEGLICKSRANDLGPDHKPFAHDIPHTSDFLQAVKTVRPSVIIGVAGAGPMFTPEVLAEMAEINDRPIVFALSNPTSKQECTAIDAYKYTHGRCVYASGSPQPSLVVEEGEYAGKEIHPSQGNNVYIFPGVGMACVLSGARYIPQRVFLKAAQVTAAQVTDEEIAMGKVFPDLDRIRDVSIKVAAEVMDYFYSATSQDSIASFMPEPLDKEAHIRARVYQTDYPDLSPEVYGWGEEFDEKSENKGPKPNLHFD